jgi:phosphoribosylanthranilate isomerase
VIVQIYEIQTPHEAEKCIELGVDHIGSVLADSVEWRKAPITELIQLSHQTKTRNSLIPLFNTEDILYRALDFYRPDYVHFCDSLTDSESKSLDLERVIDFQARLKDRFPEIALMRSIPIPRPGTSPHFPTLDIAARLEPVTDIFLTDTWIGKEPVKGYIGITGKPCDWEIAEKLVTQSAIPVILAGGLAPDNVYEALLKAKPAGADSCTGTNAVSRRGKPIRFKKDFSKVEQFIHEVRRAEAALGVGKGAEGVRSA